MTSKAPPRHSEGCPAPGSPRVPRPSSGAHLPASRRSEAGRERGACRSPEQPLSVTAAERQRGRVSGPGGPRLATPKRRTRGPATPNPASGSSCRAPWRPLASEPQPAPVSDVYQGRAGGPGAFVSVRLRAGDPSTEPDSQRGEGEGARYRQQSSGPSPRPGAPGSQLTREAGGPAGGS